MQLLLYLAALLPILALTLLSRDFALSVTLAPLAMILAIAIGELKVLRLSDTARDRLMPESEADRIHGAFAFRAKALLRRITARRDLAVGKPRLVAEQSELAQVPPLTFVLIRSAEPSPHVVDFAQEDHGILSDLFDDELNERDLHRANLRMGEAIREVSIDASGVSVHARLAACMDAHR